MRVETTKVSTRKNVSAMELFERYTTVDEKGEIDVSGVFSKECFEEWLRTRKQPPKEPVHAYRKAVTGHCRGDCGLKPFKPKVEAAVLKIIRKHQVWSCFKDFKLKIGRRGCQSYGYWELRKRANSASSFSDDASASGLLQGCVDAEFRNQSQNSHKKKRNLEEEKHSEIHKKKRALSDKEVVLVDSMAKRFESAKEQSIMAPTEPFQKLFSMLYQKFPKESFYLVLAQLARENRSFDIFNSTFETVSKIKRNHRTFLCSKDFVIPTPEECKFSFTDPIGNLVADPLTYSYVECDAIAESIFGRNITGITALILNYDEYQGVCFLDEALKIFFKKREVWVRHIYSKPDGSPIVFIARYYIKSYLPNTCFLQIQDVTKQFQGYL